MPAAFDCETSVDERESFSFQPSEVFHVARYEGGKRRIGLLCNDDPINKVDPDGRCPDFSNPATYFYDPRYGPGAGTNLTNNNPNNGWQGVPYAYPNNTGAAPTTTPPGGGNYSAVDVTLPNGTQYMPITTVKNQAQATQLGVPVGSTAPIIVPPGINPNNMINDWSQPGLSNNSAEFALTWRPGGPNDYKRNYSPIYDAYGNFEYGATGAAAGYSSQTLTNMGDVLHGGSNNPINTRDIQSGFNAVNNGGVITTPPVHYP